MTTRRQLAENAGFISARRTAKDNGWNTLYLADAQGIPSEDGGKYAIVCEQHSTIMQTNNKRDARGHLRAPDFCDCCRGTCIPSWARGEDWTCSACGKNGRSVSR